MVGKTAFSGESAQHLLRSVFVVMPLGFSPAANLLPPPAKTDARNTSADPTNHLAN